MEETTDGSASLASLDRRKLRFEAEAHGPEKVSARADAGAIVPLQSRLRGLRKDPVSRPHSQGRAVARGLLQSSGRVRNSNGRDPRRRTVAAPPDAGDRCWPGCAQEV